jgi:diguanylate cyclase (GGDEF)-like protein/PAS domain S-box-containing protein
VTPVLDVTRPFRALRGLWQRMRQRVAPASERARISDLGVESDGSDSDRRLSFMLESVPINLWSTDSKLNITFSQGAGLHLIGSSGQDQVGMTLYEVLKTRDPRFTPLAAHLRALQGELVRYEVEWRGRSFETRVEPLRSADGHISGTVGIAIDVTDRKTLYNALQKQNVYFASLFESAPEAIAILDTNDLISRINGEFTTLFGYSADEAIGKSINDLIVPPELVAEGESLTAQVASGESVRTESLRRHKDGRPFWVSIAATPFQARDEPGKVYAMYHDISDRKKAEDELKEQSLRDALTGLPNRRGFTTLSEQALKLAMRMERDVLTIFIDVDQLKQINDTFGHLEGDRALIDTARVLRDSCREADIVARLGGDEFVALMIVDSDQTGELVCERIKGRLDTTNTQTPRGYTLSLSLGAKRSKAEGITLVDLLAQADTALYEQKRARGRNTARSGVLTDPSP